MKPEMQELIDRANNYLFTIIDEQGLTDDTRVLIMVTSLLERYVNMGDKAGEAMSAAAEEITELRKQVAQSRQGASLLALEKERERNAVMLEALQAIVGATTQGFLSTANIIATTTIKENSNG